MFSVQTADSLVSAIAFMLAYIISETIAGALCAWIMARLGDDTAESAGFTSLNPMVHIDLLGFFCFYVAGLGWGRQVPFNPSHIDQKWHKAKVLLAFLAETLIHLALAILGIVFLAAYVGPHVFNVTMPMLAFFDLLTPRFLTETYPNLSSLSIVLSFVVISIVYVNTMRATLSLLLNGFRYCTDLIITRYGSLGRYADLVWILVPLALIIFFGAPLRLLIIKCICTLGLMLGATFCLV